MQNCYELYLVASKGSLSEDEFLNILDLALKGGVDMLQLREKELCTRDFYLLAQKVSKLCEANNRPLIINDRLDIALAVNAHGLHIGQEDLPASVARRLLGSRKILGLSVNKLEHLHTLDESLVDYLGVGAVYETPTKPSSKAIGIKGLKAIISEARLPVVAIGGVDEHTLKSFKGCGVAGFAVVRAIMEARDVQEATKNLRTQICSFTATAGRKNS